MPTQSITAHAVASLPPALIVQALDSLNGLRLFPAFVRKTARLIDWLQRHNVPYEEDGTGAAVWRVRIHCDDGEQAIVRWHGKLRAEFQRGRY
jgi:hypothetical protein